MSETLKIDQFSILATSTRVDDRTRVLKQGETFAVFDRFGDVVSVGQGELGLYHRGTRFLSELRLVLGEERPLLLSSAVKLDNTLFAADLTNLDVLADGQPRIPKGTVHVARQRILWDAAWLERVRVVNYGLEPISVALVLQYENDFADIFEVRGTRRERRGLRLEPRVDGNAVVLAYDGLDGIRRSTRIELSPPPASLTGTEAMYEIALSPQDSQTLSLTVRCETAGETPAAFTFAEAGRRQAEERDAQRAQDCSVQTSNEQFDRWIDRSLSDLHMMMTDMPEGPYPFGGVPWFSTPFGRDGIITALELLWVNSSVARGVLAYLAATQAKRVVPEDDAEPGKILHEARQGEMVNLNEVPFGRYYGSVDSTPLFVMLAAAYFERTGDLAFIREIWPNVERALGWIDEFGDRDRDGFVEYLQASAHGLANQGWKDSHDAIFHADGALARGPIALCEVQGYVFAARRGAAILAEALGNPDRAEALRKSARELQQRFEEAFWLEELSTYALALDGEKRPCRVRTSNPGHCLLTGIAELGRAVRVADQLLSHQSFSGFGIRTVASSEARYNPMSYHDGSVWPHDNALVAAGFARYALKEPVKKVLGGLFEASQFFEFHRMPELFCGFSQTSGEGPTHYPVACSPQSWAAASVFLLLQAALGLSIHAINRTVSFSYPVLPDGVDEIRIERLRVADASVDLLLRRHGSDVSINVLRRDGEVGVVAVK